MIDIAIDAAKQAGALAYQYFKTQQSLPAFRPRLQSEANRQIRYKPDNSPVTRADIEAEKLIRKIISKNFPDHGIIGEELPAINPRAKYQWVIDPIDGTKSFIRNIPFWSTLLALLKDGDPIVGIAFFPAINQFYIAQKGKGAHCNDQKMRVSKINDLKFAFLNHGSIHYLEETGKLNGFLKIASHTQAHRGFGDAFGYSLVVCGKVDIYLDPKSKIYDLAAPALLVEEAGGKFSDFSGKFSITSGNAVATNGLLHAEVLKILNS